MQLIGREALSFLLKEMLSQPVNKAELRFSFHQWKVKIYVSILDTEKDSPVTVFAVIIIICKQWCTGTTAQK